MKTIEKRLPPKKANTKPTCPGDAECKRCHNSFTPYWIDCIDKWSTHCDQCQVRNIFDGLNMMTPPDLIDQHSKKPALTDAEFKRSLR